jgi:hypothetical protein
MVILYLFIIQNLNCYIDDRNFAIISEERLDTLEELNEGDTTNFFDELKIEKDIVKYKLVIQFLSENLNKIIINYKKNSRIYIEKDKKDFWCFIDNDKYYIVDYSFDESNIIFNYIYLLYLNPTYRTCLIQT